MRKLEDGESLGAVDGVGDHRCKVYVDEIRQWAASWLMRYGETVEISFGVFGCERVPADSVTVDQGGALDWMASG